MHLYSLKRQHGKWCTLYKRGEYSPDYALGTTSNAVQTRKLLLIQIEQNISLNSLVAAIKQATDDPLYQNTDSFLIDLNDLPAGWTVGPKDWITNDKDRYEIINTHLSEHFGCIIAYCKKMQGIQNRVISLNAVVYASMEVAVES